MLSRCVCPSKLFADACGHAMQLRPALCEQVSGSVGISICFGKQLAVTELCSSNGMLRGVGWHPCQINMILRSINIIETCKDEMPSPCEWPRCSGGP